MSRIKGFTLIELLIVVAIIGILSSIAAVNYLNAQVRAKVARVKSEHMGVVTALELYVVDNNHYPRNTYFDVWGDLSPGGDPIWGTMPGSLTTPVEYITSVTRYDPFAKFGLPYDQQVYTYHNLKWRTCNDGTSSSPVCGNIGYYQFPSPEAWIGQWGMYRIGSIGPDAVFQCDQSPAFVNCPGGINTNYDPTNGTISFGNIWRSQKWAEPSAQNETFTSTYGL
jgi:prepilin-type N-terminal cleavage/methylation domain-containing protein